MFRKYSVSSGGWRLTIRGLALFAILATGSSMPAPNEEDKPALAGKWGDQGDGTYANPVLPADFSDLDAIRVGSDYYAISSTMQYAPGMAVLHSKDLVNWRIIGHAVDDLTRISSELNWNRMNRAGRGIWAGSIRYHAGKYWVYFGTSDEGLFMTTAMSPSGPWTPVELVMAAPGWDDPCPFWDDNGQGYLVTSHFKIEESNGKSYNIHLFKLSPDGQHLLMDSDRIIHQSKGSEANKLYKWNGLYYHFFSEVRNEGRVVMMGRASHLEGPWETRQLNHVSPAVDREPNQGGLIQLPSGVWYFLTHQGKGEWEGRPGSLLPVTWVDGWPVPGAMGPDGMGVMQWHGKKPITGFPLTSLVADDDFTSRDLKPAWEWKYQPRSDRWSLSERPGFLRLHAFQSLHPGEFNTVGNILTQRCMRTAHNEATVKLDLSGMADGQEAGIAHFAKTFGRFGVKQIGAARSLSYVDSSKQIDGPVISQPALWLRSEWNVKGESRFSYSLDGRDFKAFGDLYQLTWGSYRGDRLGIFTFNELGEHGYLDVDSVSWKVAR